MWRSEGRETAAEQVLLPVLPVENRTPMKMHRLRSTCFKIVAAYNEVCELYHRDTRNDESHIGYPSGG